MHRWLTGFLTTFNLKTAAYGRAASWGYAPPAPPRLWRFARATRSHPATQGQAPRPTASPNINTSPQRGPTAYGLESPPPQYVHAPKQLSDALLVRGGVPPPCLALRATDSTPLWEGKPSPRYAAPPTCACGAVRQERRGVQMPTVTSRNVEALLLIDRYGVVLR